MKKLEGPFPHLPPYPTSVTLLSYTDTVVETIRILGIGELLLVTERDAGEGSSRLDSLADSVGIESRTRWTSKCTDIGATLEVDTETVERVTPCHSSVVEALNHTRRRSEVLETARRSSDRRCAWDLCDPDRPSPVEDAIIGSIDDEEKRGGCVCRIHIQIQMLP